MNRFCYLRTKSLTISICCYAPFLWREMAYNRNYIESTAIHLFLLLVSKGRLIKSFPIIYGPFRTWNNLFHYLQEHINYVLIWSNLETVTSEYSIFRYKYSTTMGIDCNRYDYIDIFIAQEQMFQANWNFCDFGFVGILRRSISEIVNIWLDTVDDMHTVLKGRCIFENSPVSKFSSMNVFGKRYFNKQFSTPYFNYLSTYKICDGFIDPQNSLNLKMYFSELWWAEKENRFAFIRFLDLCSLSFPRIRWGLV